MRELCRWSYTRGHFRMFAHAGRQFAVSQHRADFSLWAIHRSVPSGVLAILPAKTWRQAAQAAEEWVDSHPGEREGLPPCKEPE